MVARSQHVLKKEGLLFVWCAGSRPKKFSRHFIIKNALVDSAPVALKSAVIGVGAMVLVDAFSAITTARDLDSSASLATPGGNGDNDMQALTRLQLRVLQLRKREPRALQSIGILYGAGYPAINQNMRVWGSSKARVDTTVRADTKRPTRTSAIGAPLARVQNQSAATEPIIWPPPEDVVPTGFTFPAWTWPWSGFDVTSTTCNHASLSPSREASSFAGLHAGELCWPPEWPPR